MMKKWDSFVRFIEEVKAGALATVDDDKPQVRAVVFVSLGERNIIYTTTSHDTRKVNQIKNNPNISFFIWREHDFFRGGGEAEISKDLDLKKKILDKNPSWREYYPLGFKDPNYCLIRIKVNNLESNLKEA